MRIYKGRPSTATEHGRTCHVCKVFKPHTEFFKDKRFAFGSGGRCKECNRAKGAKDRAKGQELRKTGLPEGVKTCTVCKKTKDVAEFNFCSHGAKGRQAPCKECYRDISRNKVYGVDRATYDTMLQAQNHVCAICGQPERKKRGGRVTALCVDHNHTTGAIRGLLCYNCNVHLGIVEREGFLEKAVAYLRIYGEWGLNAYRTSNHQWRT